MTADQVTQSKWSDESSKQAIERFVRAKLRIAYLHLSQPGWDGSQSNRDETRQQAWQTLAGFAYRELRDAERELFAWHAVRLDDERIREATKDALHDFWDKPMDVMHLLNLARSAPGAYMTKNEEQFRRELQEAIERV